ncbi:unnamed protein product [Lactuca virosa]|uniref:Uncharacterized protein n=1 Tax=Lactuca virosa TaxID=75947 RepID=A0AAU9PW48_9ASTR|nr:unnamed protein product [Lactuca virosa]
MGSLEVNPSSSSINKNNQDNDIETMETQVKLLSHDMSKSIEVGKMWMIVEFQKVDNQTMLKDEIRALLIQCGWYLRVSGSVKAVVPTGKSAEKSKRMGGGGGGEWFLIEVVCNFSEQTFHEVRMGPIAKLKKQQ